MRRLGIALLLLTLAAPVFAQDKSGSATFSIGSEQPRERVEIGAIEVNTHAARIRFAYLPRLAPLPGTFPTRSWGQIPNALEVSGVQIPEPPRTMPAYLVAR